MQRLSNAAQRWLMVHRRRAAGLLDTPYCPDECDCREHLLARVKKLQAEVKAATGRPS
jgi:hypothetical protein